MRKQKGVILNCFSPPVMIVTMAAEICMAMYAIWRYKFTPALKLIFALLLGLASFQLAEFFVCTGYINHQLEWSRLGFVMVSLLPPLGIHLMHVLAGKPGRKIVNTAYITTTAFIGVFLISDVFTGHKCTGNYVIFQFTGKVTGAYSLYYFGWLLAGIGLGVKWAEEFKIKGKAALKQLQAVQALILGYLVFLVPSALAMVIKPQSRQGVPSVLCGFAILLALILTFYILPRAAERKRG
jgi:hypothetical protein